MSMHKHLSMPRESGNVKFRDRVENQRGKYEEIFRRIGKFRKYINDVCNTISNHAVKVAALRDKNDEVAKCFDEFTKIEEFSTTSKLCMAVAAELIATVGDHQDLAVQRVETLVLPNLCSYARICDCIKADVWNAIQAIRREKRKRKRVKTLNKKSGDPKTKSCLTDAMRELERASAETARFCQLSEEQVIKFEHKRLIDLKESLGTFVKIQIAASAKSLELLSETYKQIQSIDENEDLEILKNSLKIGNKVKDRKKSATTLKQKQSQKSLNGSKSSVKTSTQTLKDQSGESCSEDTSNESLHSDDVRNLEKFLHSNHEIYKQGKNRRSSPRESHSCERKQSKDKEYLRKEKPRNVTRYEKRDNENTRVSTPRSARSSKNCHETTFSDDEYVYLKPKMLGKRPSTPPRPVTVPLRSSTEDLSSRHDSFAFNRNKQRPIGKSILDSEKSYYYSQSEDEKRRKQSGFLLKESKHVTFCNLSNNRNNAPVKCDSSSTKRATMLSSIQDNRNLRRDAGDLLRYHEPQKRILDLNGTGTQKQPLKSYC